MEPHGSSHRPDDRSRGQTTAWYRGLETRCVRSGWSLADLNRLPYGDVLEIYQEVQRQRGEDYLDLVSVATIPHLKEREIKRSLSRFRKLATWSWTPAPSFYETLSDADRVIAIGSCLAASSSWGRGHPRQLAWLAEQGLDERKAVGRYREWRAAQAARFRNAQAQPLGETNAQHDSVRYRRRKHRGQRPAE